MRAPFLLLAAAALPALALLGERDARACGGCFVGRPDGGRRSPTTGWSLASRRSRRRSTTRSSTQRQPAVLRVGAAHQRARSPSASAPTRVFAALDSLTATTICAAALPRARRLPRAAATPSTPAPPAAAAGSSGGGGHRHLPAGRRPVRDGAARSRPTPRRSTDWLTANGYAIPPRRQPVIADVRRRGVRLPRAQARAGAGRAGDAAGARDHPRREPRRCRCAWSPPAPAPPSASPCGSSARAATSRELPLVPRRRLAARLGLCRERQQLHDAPAAEGGRRRQRDVGGPGVAHRGHRLRHELHRGDRAVRLRRRRRQRRRLGRPGGRQLPAHPGVRE